MNEFLNQMQMLSQPTARTWNGAASNATTGSRCLDYFSKAGTYRRRKQEEVDADMLAIFSENEEVALKIVFGMRLITRQPKNVSIITRNGGFLRQEIDTVQTGYGNRMEFFRACVWLHHNKPDLLYRNLRLIPEFGSWKDFMTEPLIDVLDRNKVYAIVRENVVQPLVMKFLPQIRTSKKARSERDKKRIAWAKGFCKFVGITEREYRKAKARGAAHEFQRQMSRNDWSKIDLNAIPGKAMLHLTERKGKDGMMAFQRHGQITRLTEWVMKQKTIKFNGYPYELVRAAALNKNINVIQKEIFNRQFLSMIEPMKNHQLGNVLVAMDTSGSMASPVCDQVTALDICIGMGITFASMNTGTFKNKAVHFDNTSSLIDMSMFADDFVSKLHHVQKNHMNAMGSTNFQSVIDLIVKIRSDNPGIPLEDYPTTLLVLSDMQFNPATNDVHNPGWITGYQNVPVRFINQFGQIQYGYQRVPVGGIYGANGMPMPMAAPAPANEKTNYEEAMRKLKSVGLGEMRIIWWHLNASGTSDFPSKMNDRGTYLISGFDPMNIKALLGTNEAVEEKSGPGHIVAPTVELKKKTPLEAMVDFLKQPIFELIRLKDDRN